MGVARADALAVATLDHHCFADLIPKVCSRAAGHHANPGPSLTPERQRSHGFALASPLHLHPRRHNALVPVPRWALIQVDGRAFVAAVRRGLAAEARELAREVAGDEGALGSAALKLGLPAPRYRRSGSGSLLGEEMLRENLEIGWQRYFCVFFRAEKKKKKEIRVLNRCNRTQDSVVEGRRDNMKNWTGGARAL